MLWDWERPNDPRVPEALHFAVRVTRCGCTDDETSQWSNKAFQLLHRRYAKSGQDEVSLLSPYHCPFQP
jgi:hypothetical protein